MITSPPIQGSGMEDRGIAAAEASASTATMVARACDTDRAATVTGASSSSRKGLDSPPVTAMSAASCNVSKASCRLASQPRVRRWL